VGSKIQGVTFTQPITDDIFALNVESSEERILPEDWDHFHVLLEQMLHRVPSLGDAVLERLCNGPEAFSPDCKWIMGEAPEVSTLG
jgi:glycine/D-amino acid oxidase-like deaminating enzyme